MNRTSYIYALILSSLIICGVFFSYFTTPGIPLVGDLDWAFDCSHYYQRIVPIRNELRGSINFMNLFRSIYLTPFFGICYAFGANAFVKSLFIGTLVLAAGAIQYSVGSLLQSSIKPILQKNPRYIYIFTIILTAIGVLYALNPWVIHRLQHFYLVVGYAVFPLYLLYTYRYLHSESLIDKNLLGAIITLIIGAAGVHFFFYGYIALGAIWVLYCINPLYTTSQKRHTFYQACMQGLCGALVAGFFLVPYIGSSIIAKAQQTNINTYDTVDLMSRYSDVISVFSLDSYWWPLLQYGSGIYEHIYIILFLIAGCIVLTHLPKRRDIYTLVLYGLLILLMCTGTYFAWFKDIYLSMVYHIKGSGFIGFLFRDPNKLVGIFSFFVCLIFIQATITIIHIRQAKKYKMLQKLLNFPVGVQKTLFFGLPIVFGLGIILYPISFASQYITSIYNPIQEPIGYTQNNALIQTHNKSGAVLFLPRYEQLVVPAYGYATANRNIGSPLNPKPAGAIDTFNTTYYTPQPLEMNTEMVGYMYLFLQSYIQQGWGDILGALLAKMGYKTLVYHDDIYKYDVTQDLVHIGLQGGITTLTTNDFFSYFAIHNPYPKDQKISLLVDEYGGLRKWISREVWTKTFFGSRINTSHNFVFSQPPNAIPTNTQSISSTTNIIDYKIMNTSGTIFSYPFEQIYTSDAFIGWAKTKTSVLEWKYHLNFLGIDDHDWGLDHNKGIIFSHANASLSTKHPEQAEKYGTVLFDMKDMSVLEDIFVRADDVDISNISLIYQKSAYTDTANSIKGGITKGGSQIRRLGVMKKIPVQEKNGYHIRMNVSGQGVSKLHLKARFYDTNGKQIGVGYVGTPELMQDYDHLNFAGMFVTPTHTKWMQLELASLENPSERSFWRLHDLVVKDLQAITRPNVLTYNQSVGSGIYKAYSRTFVNTYGGSVVISLNDIIVPVATKSSNARHGKRVYTYLGNVVSTGAIHISIDNQEGFNGVTEIAFVPLSGSLPYNIYPQVVLLEPEFDSTYIGNIQTYAYDTNLSNGKGVQLLDGSTSTTFDIIRQDIYTLAIKNVDIGQKKDNVLYTLTIRNQDNTTIYTQKGPYMPTWTLPDLSLGVGSYMITIDIVDNNASILSYRDIHLNTDSADEFITFVKEDVSQTRKRLENRSTMSISGGKVIFGQTDTIRGALDINGRGGNNAINHAITEILLDEKGCSYFNQDKKLKLSYPGKKLLLTQQPGYSCYWTIMKTKPIPIDMGEEYYLSFATAKEFTKIYHSKVNFFDADGHLMIIKGYNTSLGYNISNQIYDFEYEIPWEQGKKYFEFIFTTPPGAKTMRIEFRAKQRQDVTSRIEISDVILKRHKDIPGIDLITLVPSSAMSRILHPDVASNISISQLRIPFSPYRRQTDPQGKHYISNIFNNGYVVSGNTTSQVTFFPQKLYILGICISLFSFVLITVVIRKNRPSSSILSLQ